MPDDRPLAGRIAVITGGGTGLGRAIATRLAAAGAHVALAGRRLEVVERVAGPLAGSAFACDVTRIKDVERLFDVVTARLGRVDILVNNAGESGPIADITNVNLDAWRRCIDTNLLGAVHCMHVAGRIMRAQRSGSIINMSSYLGLRGYPMRTAYCASKFALIGVTEAVARELGTDNVRVNAVCPSAVSGELMNDVIARRAAAERRLSDEIIATEYIDVTALKCWIQPDDVADAVFFLASDASARITGTYIRVDAGRF